ncbi:DUF6942 family protein [Enterovibrio nigricans]|uniref:Uracil DNA glycosylase superfamily protein n=1 Tax=Enterovibrio nigricans DSM 22720 TaxID=1121868 RepID=A0A1T4UT10_9GAMM|nr:hypothetical protein [Enterovibrio nigricans]PKF50802.1 hypothetical protein AT251_08815 [Enterovibrio nigricans]SKA55768.1 hypothetical protein SAMN02745132_02428 [Enterovibrio nigricans DSM 22720]
MKTFSIGSPTATFNVYVEKAAPLTDLQGYEPEFGSTTSLRNGDIKSLGDLGGNGWRKVFNVYAKLLFDLPDSSQWYPRNSPSWQHYRDETLLQSHSTTALHFGHVSEHLLDNRHAIHIIAGRTHATKLGIAEQFLWLDSEFAKHPDKPIVICPYFDYRQLSNVKIRYLTTLITALECA